jgi:S1-C subfamily serine protease
MSTVHDPQVPAGPAEDLPPAPWTGPSPFSTQAGVAGVMAGLPAARAGLAGGDVIVSVDGHPVSCPAQIQALLEACHPGDTVSIRWDDPAGMAHAATVVLTTGPAG